MSVPAGRGEHGMPVGLQLIGNYFDEAPLAARWPMRCSRPPTGTARVPAGF